jgi:hypothetical protein
MTPSSTQAVDPATQVRDRLAGIVEQVVALADEVVALAAEAETPRMIDETVHALRRGSDDGRLWARLYLAGHRSSAEVALALADVLRVRGIEASRR